MSRELVILESPFAGATEADRQRNRRYLIAAMRHSVLVMGEAPIASHLMYTQALNDDDPAERAAGIECGLLWGAGAAKTVVYEDICISPGMVLGIEDAARRGRRIEYRRLGPGWDTAPTHTVVQEYDISDRAFGRPTTRHVPLPGAQDTFVPPAPPPKPGTILAHCSVGAPPGDEKMASKDWASPAPRHEFVAPTAPPAHEVWADAADPGGSTKHERLAYITDPTKEKP